MSTHIGAVKGQLADTVLMPGDPLRARFVAENYLTDVVCYNEVRGMLGFTGNYKGKRVSVQGSGMGMPSISIYANELYQFYDVKNIIRIGTCGAYSPKLKVRDIIVAMSASTDSAMNKLVFDGMDFAPTASFRLLRSAVENAEKLGLAVHVGPVMSSDTFYNYKPDSWKVMAAHGVLAVEMETAALYTLAARYGADALTLLTVSDHLVTSEATTAKERETTFADMMRIALETAE